MSKLRNCKYKSVVKAATKFRPWDYGFILDIEKEALIRLKEGMKNHVGSERDAERIQLAVNLLAIISEDNTQYDYIKDKMLVHVNKKNFKRFFIEKEYPISESFYNSEIFKCHLRQEKAWYLYHKLRYYHMQEWWD